MAVKIERKSKKKFVMCENCKCVLSYESEDERSKDEKRLVDHWYIECAACGGRVITRQIGDGIIINFYKEKISDFIE